MSVVADKAQDNKNLCSLLSICIFPVNAIIPFDCSVISCHVDLQKKARLKFQQLILVSLKQPYFVNSNGLLTLYTSNNFPVIFGKISKIENDF